MKVCIEIVNVVVVFPDGTHKAIGEFDSGFNRLEVVMAMLKSQIEDVIEEKNGEMLNNRVKEALNRTLNNASLFNQKKSATWTEEDEKNAVEIKVF